MGQRPGVVGNWALPNPGVRALDQEISAAKGSFHNRCRIERQTAGEKAHDLTHPDSGISQGLLHDGEITMSQIARLFTNGRSQAVRLPAVYRFDTKEVFIRQDPETGDVILSRKPASWDDFFAALKHAEVPANFLDKTDRDHHPLERDPFEGWRE
jgi:antitoxin VapB